MQHEEDLIDYSDEDVQVSKTAVAKEERSETGGPQVKGSYVGVHSSGFRDFMLKPEINRAITDCGFEHPSEIQQGAIPQAVLGTDVLCQARSGLGKTAVFIISCLQQLVPVDGEVSTIVVCNVRELAMQIKDEFTRFTKYLPEVRYQAFFGGSTIDNDTKVLQDSKTCPHIVIATPGRLNALVKSGALKTNKIKMFIFDECDKIIMQPGMRNDVQDVFKTTPPQKQVMMFTATLSKEAHATCRKFLQNPLEIIVDDENKLALPGLKQFQIKIEEGAKTNRLIDILDELTFNQVVIFVNSTSRANQLTELLKKHNFPCTTVHSGINQAERIERYKMFKTFKARICIATDVFGRGIDLERVNVVINYDMTFDKESYLHRIGRAGRFGTKGLAITFLTTTEDEQVFDEVRKALEIEVDEFPVDNKIDENIYMN